MKGWTDMVPVVTMLVGAALTAVLLTASTRVHDATDESHPDRVLAWVRQPNGPRVLFECLPVSPTRTEK